MQLCETLPPLANSDHLGIHLNLFAKIHKSTPKPHLRKIWRYDYHADFDKATELLDKIEWEIIIESVSRDGPDIHIHYKMLNISELVNLQDFQLSYS